MPRVGIYLRISDNQEGESQSLQRQEEDCRKLAELRGWEIVKIYTDDNISAFQRRVTRPAFEELLHDLRTGGIDGVVVYHIDRMARRLGDIARLMDIYEDRTYLKFGTVSGGVDLSESTGRAMAGFLVTIAGQSSEDTRRRVSRRKLERAMEGDSTSNFRAFGWNKDGTLKDDEADLLREAIRLAFADIGLPTIALSWNRRGIQTVRGKEWHSYTLRRVLSAPRIAGLAVYKGEILLREGVPVKGNWTALLPENEWRALVDIVNPRAGSPPVRRKRYLLSGIARCGLCGMGMVGGTPPGKPPRYMCRPPDSGGCAKVSVNGPKLDEQVTTLVLEYLKDHKVEEVELPGFPGETRLTEISGKIAELMTEYREGGMSAGLIFPEIRKLEDEQRQLQSEQSKYTRKKKRATTVTGEWPDLDLDERRALILSVLEAVVVKPVGRGGGGYRPERAEIVWL